MKRSYGLQYGYRAAAKIAEQDRVEQKARQASQPAGGQAAASSGGDVENIAAGSYEWELMERGIIDAAMASRLIKGREDAKRKQLQSGVEKLGMG